MKRKVLVVDDEPDVLESTAGLVESMGYDAIRLPHAGGILDAVERERPDVLLQDLKMPGLNVSGLVAALRSNPASVDLPIIFFSANPDLPGTAARMDAWGYLSKPFGKAELSRLLRDVLGEPKAGSVPTGSTLRRDVRGVFHDQWNLLAALSNYVVLIEETEGLPAALRKKIQDLDEVILQLESKTDRLQSYILGLLESMAEEEGAASSENASAHAVGARQARRGGGSSA